MRLCHVTSSGFAVVVFVGAMVLLSGLAAQPCSAAVLFDNWNKAGVWNGGTSPSFTISEPYELTRIYTYHWNYGNGDSPGRLGLYRSSDGATWSWPAQPLPGYGNLGSDVWLFSGEPILDPGTYQVQDDHPATWSSNPESGWYGFARVEGNAVPEPATLSLLALGSLGAFLRRKRT